MTIQVDYNYPSVPVADYDRIIHRVIETALDYENCPYECQVYVLLTDNETIHEVNLEHRGIDRPTDVLSFPMTEYPLPADFSDIEERDPDAFHPDTGQLMLGDMIISMDKVQEQVGAYGHSLTRELAFLVAHSTLHLLGYDHLDDRERQIMEEKQEAILGICGYTREMQDLPEPEEKI